MLNPVSTLMLNNFFYRPQEVADLLGVSRSKIYELLNTKELVAVKENRKTLITRGSILGYVQKLERTGKKYGV